MKLRIETENGNIQNVILKINPVEFQLIKQLLNLKCVYTELSIPDRQTAESLYKDIDGQLKEIQRQ